jgi:hypothetical protein
MTTGLSGSFAFNNIDLQLPPSDGKWVERTDYGVDGDAHVVYSAFREFELSWDLQSTSDASQIIGFYNLVSATGTLVACLPKWGDPTYTFYNYSGTTLREPTFDSYFMGYPQTAKMLIMNVRT